jgi:hypothetical protein
LMTFVPIGCVWLMSTVSLSGGWLKTKIPVV